MAARTCWQCAAQIGDELFCPNCQALQPAPSDYFSLFGMPTRLALDEAELQKQFYTLSRQLHPDRFTRKSAHEQQLSLDASSVLNDAFRTLRNPVERAEYVLKREGFDIGKQRGKDVPPELLEEVFELNMALEELRDGDASVKPQLETAKGNFASMQQAIDGELQTLYERYDAAPSRDVLQQIRGVLNRRRYIQNLIRDVDKELATAA